MARYFYTRRVHANGHMATLPFNSSHNPAFGDHDHLPPFRAKELMAELVNRWNAFRPDLYHYEIAEAS